MEEVEEKNGQEGSRINKPDFPFILRVVVIFIMVESSLGFLFFLMALLFRLFDSHFLLEIDYNGLSGNSFIAYLVVLMLLHAGILVSSILLFNRRLTGFYLYLLTLITLLVISFFTQEEIIYVAPLAGLLSVLIILRYKNKLI